MSLTLSANNTRRRTLDPNAGVHGDVQFSILTSSSQTEFRLQILGIDTIMSPVLSGSDIDISNKWADRSASLGKVAKRKSPVCKLLAWLQALG